MGLGISSPFKVEGTPVTVTTTGDTTIYSPPSGKRVRLLWICMAASDANPNETVVEVRFGSNGIYRLPMAANSVFAHSSIREGGVDEALIVNSSVLATIYANVDLEVF
jgi:hypothetical protein